MCPIPTTGSLTRLTRRHLLQVGGAAAVAALLPGAVGAAPGGRPGEPATATLVDPYTGSIPLVFPVTASTYRKMWDTWHAQREGDPQPWSHQNGSSRAHDGIDINPRSTRSLPAVYAPFAGSVAAVCWRSDNTLNANVTYAVNNTTPPPQDYHAATDTAAGLPLYGNFIWIVNSAGYFAFYCHLQNDTTLRALADKLARGENIPVATDTAVGVMGETGNAVGDPQLHVEIHYPRGNSYTCTRCPAGRPAMTAINPYRSLANAATRR